LTGLPVLCFEVQHACDNMKILAFFRELYSLDILDTRFTHSASTPLKSGNEGTSKAGQRDGKPLPTDISPPRWRTPEFYFYTLIFMVCVPQMYWAVVTVSQRKIFA